MNIKITYNWLREYLDTDADAYELQKYLSLCGASVEHVIEVGSDWALDIEITSNRIDMASVWGVAQEAAAILPRFGKKAHLRSNPLTHTTSAIPKAQHELPFTLTVEDPHLATCACAVVMDELDIHHTPAVMKERLEACDIRSINPVVDITNYIMLAIGQPTHAFDYDKIAEHSLTIRAAQKGEQITTLDGKSYTLPGGDIVGVDGAGTLTDLCGIMGGKTSAVDETTKRIVLFVQTYNKRQIRTTSMATSARSTAAAYFEKGLDEERVEAAVALGEDLFADITSAKRAAIVWAAKPEPRPKTIQVTHTFITDRIGASIPADECAGILTALGFAVQLQEDTLQITVPSWRKHDIEIPEDIVEEVARIYGYHNLPNIMSPPANVSEPHEVEQILRLQMRIAHALKHLGLHESINYSMISAEMVSWLELDPASHLELEDTMSEDWKYMRISLLPSLLANMKTNFGMRKRLEFFEIAKVYYPQENELPKEIYKVAFATNTSFERAKGIGEALLKELNIPNWNYSVSDVAFFSTAQVDMRVGDCVLGTIGMLKKKNQLHAGIKEDVYLASFDLKALLDYTSTIPHYQPINPYAAIKLDLTINSAGRTYAQFTAAIKKASSTVESVDYLSSFEASVTVRITMTRHDRNMTEKEAHEELLKIQQVLQTPA